MLSPRLQLCWQHDAAAYHQLGFSMRQSRLDQALYALAFMELRRGELPPLGHPRQANRRTQVELFAVFCI